MSKLVKVSFILEVSDPMEAEDIIIASDDICDGYLVSRHQPDHLGDRTSEFYIEGISDIHINEIV